MKFKTFKAGRWSPRYLCKGFEHVLASHKLVKTLLEADSDEIHRTRAGTVLRFRPLP